MAPATQLAGLLNPKLPSGTSDLRFRKQFCHRLPCLQLLVGRRSPVTDSASARVAKRVFIWDFWPVVASCRLHPHGSACKVGATHVDFIVHLVSSQCLPSARTRLCGTRFVRPSIPSPYHRWTILFGRQRPRDDIDASQCTSNRCRRAWESVHR